MDPQTWHVRFLRQGLRVARHERAVLFEPMQTTTLPVAEGEPVSPGVAPARQAGVTASRLAVTRPRRAGRGPAQLK